MKAGMYVSAVLTVLVPVAAVLLLFSQISPLAPVVLQHVATLPLYIRYITLAVSIASGIALWELSKDRFLSPSIFWSAWWATIGLAFVAGALAVPRHPVISIAALAALGPVLLFPLRQLALAHLEPAVWFKVAWVATAVVSGLCVALWLPWIALGFPGREKWTDWTDPMGELVSQQVISWKCAFVLWSAPPCIALELGLVALLCWVRHQHACLAASSEASARDVVVMSSVKQLMGWLAALAMILWIHASMNATGQQEFNQTREDMSDEVMGLALIAFSVLTLWVMDTIGPKEVAIAIKKSKVVQETRGLLQNDWIRGFLLLVAAVPMLLYTAFDFIYLSVQGRSKEREHNLLLRWTADWRWTSILVKSSWLGVFYVSIMVGVGKLTTVLLAMVNEHFSGWPVFTVSAVMFFITLAIFLFPASPGPPIYVVMGIVICSSAARQGWGFLEGLLWATFVAFAMKLAFTAMAQKLIGEPFSKSERVRYLVGLHTPYMRAIEEILRQPGVTWAKVALLVGGPDWPVAVLCGIMRLPVLSVQLCVSPVVLQSVLPCVLAGALFLEQSEGQRKSHGLAEVVLIVAGVLQLAMGILAFYYVQEVLERDYDALSKSRPEDSKLEELEAKADALDRAFWRETAWESLPCGLRLALAVGLACIEASLVLLANQEACFRKFSLMSSVQHDLGGSVLAIVKPLGWAAIALAGIDALALWAFYAWARMGTPGGASQLLDRDQLANEGRRVCEARGP